MKKKNPRKVNISLRPDPNKSFRLGNLTTTQRHHLSQALTQPIRTRLDYNSIGRKVLLVEPLPQGSLPIYDKDLSIADMVISKRSPSETTIKKG